MSAENENKGNDNNKVVAAYEKNMKKLIAIVGGESNLRPISSVKKDSIEGIAKELFKEETEAMEANIKNELKTLLKKHVEMKKAIEDKKKELNKLEVDKKKEFNEAAVKLFNKINDLGSLEQDYYSALNDANDALNDTTDSDSSEEE